MKTAISKSKDFKASGLESFYVGRGKDALKTSTSVAPTGEDTSKKAASPQPVFTPETFLQQYRVAYEAKVTMDEVPMVYFRRSEVVKNPAPSVFVSSEDGKRWLNKNPDPKRYAYNADTNAYQPQEVTWKSKVKANKKLGDFMGAYEGAYYGEAKKVPFVPVVAVSVAEQAENPDPKVFKLREDNAAWVNKNPDPAWYLYETAKGGRYVRQGRRISERRQRREAKKRGWISRHAGDIKDISWRTGNLVSVIKGTKATRFVSRKMGFRRARAMDKGVDKVGRTANNVVAFVRIKAGLEDIQRGLRERDLKKKFAGSKELVLGLSIVNPLFAPVGFSMWAALCFVDFKEATKEPELEGEMKALGWGSSATAWAIKGLSKLGYLKSAAWGTASSILGGVGAGLLLGKDISNFFEAFDEQDKGKRMTALGLIGLDVGMLGGVLGAGAVFSGASMFLGLVPMMLYNWVPPFKRFTDRILDFVDRQVTARVYPPVKEFLQPVTQPLAAFRRKMLKPFERLVMHYCVDKPIQALEHITKPAKRGLGKIGADEAFDVVSVVLADEVIGRPLEGLNKIERWVGTSFKKAFPFLGQREV